MHQLSIPTWVIHISSVLEWMVAIACIQTFGRLHPNQGWHWLSWAMLPALVSAMCALTWHYFDNSESLTWLVTVQAALTFIGNCTLCAAAGWIWYRSRPPSENIQSVPGDQDDQS